MGAYSIVEEFYTIFHIFSHLYHILLPYVTAINTFQQTKYALFNPLVNNYAFLKLFIMR